MNAVLAIAKALVQERSRRGNSWVLLVLMAVSGYFFIPSTWQFFGARGIYTSGYVGAAIAMRSTFLLAILGFFLVRGSIEEDRRRRIGEILASTPLRRLSYLLGKMLGSIAYLCLPMLVVFLMAAVMQGLYGEAPLRPLELLWPFLLFTVPAVVYVSGLALLFEIVPILRYWPGDVLFILFLLSPDVNNELPGFSLHLAALSSYLNTHPDAFIDTALGKAFVWPGIPYSLDMILPRLKWVALGTGLLLVSSLLFDRFAEISSIRFRLPGQFRTRRKKSITPVHDTLFSTLPTASAEFTTRIKSLWNMVIAEVIIVLKNRPWYLVVCVVLLGASLVISEESLRRYLLPVALLFTIGIAADIGCREHLHGISELVFSAPRIWAWYPIWKWCASFVLISLSMIGPIITMLFRKQFASGLALIVGISFISALAVSSSIWTKEYRLYVVVYVLLWWTMVSGIDKNGPVWLDYAGVWYGGTNLPVICLYLILTFVLLEFAMILSRWRRG